MNRAIVFYIPTDFLGFFNNTMLMYETRVLYSVPTTNVKIVMKFTYFLGAIISGGLNDFSNG